MCVTKVISNAEEITGIAAIVHAFNKNFDTAQYQQTFPSCAILSRGAHYFYLLPRSADEVLQVIMALKTTGTGLDGIHPFDGKGATDPKYQS